MTSRNVVVLVGGSLGFLLVLLAALAQPPESSHSAPNQTTSSAAVVATVLDDRTTTTMSTPTTTVFGGPFGELLLHAPIAGLAPSDFGRTEEEVTAALLPQFPGIEHYASNYEDLAIVVDGEYPHLRYRSDTGTNSRTQFEVPIAVHDETYLVYRFLLEDGFDAGDGDGSEGSPSWGTGVKLPGLMRGDAADNTGGNHTAGGFSGRLMIRGTRKSDGRVGLPREGLTLSSYVYGQAINGEGVASGFGRTYYFLTGFEEQPFEGINDGVVGGVGDDRIWDLPTGKWVTVVLGYRVDGPAGWFKAWTIEEGSDTTPQERLLLRNLDWTGETGGPDSLLFQLFWGGSGSVWYPDQQSHVQFRDFAVFTDERDALHFGSVEGWLD